MQTPDAHRLCTDVGTSQDFVSGIMKIVPSEVDVSIAFYLSLTLVVHNILARRNLSEVYTQ